MNHRFAFSLRGTSALPRLGGLRGVAAVAALAAGMAAVPAQATILNLDAFAAGGFTLGNESGYQLSAYSGTLRNSARSGSSNLENDPSAGANAVLLLRRLDGGTFRFQGADFASFAGPGAVFLQALLGASILYSMTTPSLGASFATVASLQPTVEVDKLFFALGSGTADGTVETIDNINVASGPITPGVPEPGALGLALLALGVGAGTTRRLGAAATR